MGTSFVISMRVGEEVSRQATPYTGSRWSFPLEDSFSGASKVALRHQLKDGGKQRAASVTRGTPRRELSVGMTCRTPYPAPVSLLDEESK